MYQQKYEGVLINGDDSDEDELQIPDSRFFCILEQFSQLRMQVDKEVQQKYQPICIMEKSNSLVIKCKLRGSQAKQGKQQIPEEFVIKIYPNAKQQAKILDRILKLQQCKFLVQMKEFYENSIIFELYQGHLKQLIVNNIQLSTPLVSKIMKQCLHSLAILQKYKIVHGDVKPDNILFKSHNKNIEYFVLTDFTSSFSLDEKSQKICRQTWPYRAPEWLKDNINIDNKIDVWSLGCVLFECITGQNFLPLQIQDLVVYEKMLREYGQQQSIRHRLERNSFTSQINTFRPLLMMMLEKDPKKRATISFLIEAFQKIQ